MRTRIVLILPILFLVFSCIEPRITEDQKVEWRAMFNYKYDTSYLFYDYELGENVKINIESTDYQENYFWGTQGAPPEETTYLISYDLDLDSADRYFIHLIIGKVFKTPFIENTNFQVHRGEGSSKFTFYSKPDSLYMKQNPNQTEEMLYVYDESILDFPVLNSKAKMFVTKESGIQWVTDHEGDTILRRVF